MMFDPSDFLLVCKHDECKDCLALFQTAASMAVNANGAARLNVYDGRSEHGIAVYLMSSLTNAQEVPL